MKVYLGLGSNLGDRRANLQQAIEAIDALPCTAVEAVSSIIETEPEGCFDGCCEAAQPCEFDAHNPDKWRGKCTGRSSEASDKVQQSSNFDEHNPRTRFGKSAAWKDEVGLNLETRSGRFLNCCIRISTAIPPQRLLEAVKEIERKLGRTNEGIRKNEKGERIYSDRPIDIDILLYGKRSINEPGLQIPHPRMQEREFVMRPLREIAAKLPEMSQNGEKK